MWNSKSKKAWEVEADELSPFFRQGEVIGMLKGKGILLRCEAAGWLKPRLRKPKYVIYRRGDVLKVLARLDAGEYPE